MTSTNHKAKFNSLEHIVFSAATPFVAAKKSSIATHRFTNHDEIGWGRS
jgi:hypothetical protein